MPIDLFSEQVIPLRDYPKYLPRRNGKQLSRYAGYRHAISGIRGVKLETIRLPGGLHTSVEAVARFVAHLTNAPSHPQEPPQTHRNASRRQTEVEQAIERMRAKIRKPQGGAS